MRFHILRVSRVELNNLLTQEIVASIVKALFILRPHKEAINHEQIKCGVHSEKSKPFSPAPPSPGQPASPALSSAAPAGPDVFSPTPDSLAQSFPSSYPQMSLQGDKEDIYKVGYDRWFVNYLIETARTILDVRKKLENRADYTSMVRALLWKRLIATKGQKEKQRDVYVNAFEFKHRCCIILVYYKITEGCRSQNKSMMSKLQ